MSDYIIGYAPPVTVSGNVITWAKGDWDKVIWPALFTTSHYVANLSLGSPASQAITAIGGAQADGTFQITVADASGWKTNDRCAPQRQAIIYWYTVLRTGYVASSAADTMMLYYGTAGTPGSTQDGLIHYSGIEAGLQSSSNGKPTNVYGMLANQRVFVRPPLSYRYPMGTWYNDDWATWNGQTFTQSNYTIINLYANTSRTYEFYPASTSSYTCYVVVSRVHFLTINTSGQHVMFRANGTKFSFLIENCVFDSQGQGPGIFVYASITAGYGVISHCTAYLMGVGVFFEGNGTLNWQVYNCLTVNDSYTLGFQNVAGHVGYGNRSSDSSADDFAGAGSTNNVANVSRTTMGMPATGSGDGKFIPCYVPLIGSALTGVGSTGSPTTIDILGNTRPSPPTPGAYEPCTIADPANIIPAAGGTYDLPALNKVAPSDTLGGAAGTLDLPALNKVAPSDTLEGVAGTLDLPALAAVDPLDTLEGVAGTLDLPEIDNVLTGDTLRGVPGGFDALLFAVAFEAARNTVPDLSLIPTPATGGPAAWLQLNISRAGTLDLDAVKAAYEAARNDTLGTVASGILEGNRVKIRGETIVGTGTGGGGEAPATPTLAVTDKADGTGATFLMSGASDGTTSTAYTIDAAGTITSQGTIENGVAKTVSQAVGPYWAYIVSTNGSASSISALVAYGVTDASAGFTRGEFGEEFLAAAADMLEEFGEEVTYRRGEAAVTLTGIKDRVAVTYRDETGIDVAVGDSSWSFLCDDLDFGGGPFEPRKHDQIVLETGEVYEVMAPGTPDGDRVFRLIPTTRAEYVQ